jgi:transposase InsO family protein
VIWFSGRRAYMPWKSETVMDQRIEFVMRARRKEETVSKLCKEYGISRDTGYRWLRRRQEAGSMMGLKEKSRRPRTSPNQTPVGTEDLVVRLRNEKGWGARKLGLLLEQMGEHVSSATIHRILIRRGLISQEPGARKATKRFERSECNQMAQMDFKGEYEIEGGKCYPLSFLDDCSRYLLGLWPLTSTGALGVYESLRSHFRQIGVPESILTDHGTPWYSTTNGHGLTWLSVWLIKQGISIRYSGVGHPQTQGKVERFHRTLKERTRHRRPPTTLEGWQQWAEEFRAEYNNERPHEALGMKTPAEVYNYANLREYREKPPEWEYTGGQVTRLNTQGKVYYRGRYYFACEALAKERVRVDEIDGHLLVTFRHITIREIDLSSGSSIAVVIPARLRLRSRPNATEFPEARGEGARLGI